MCFRQSPVVLGTEGIQPSPFWCVLPILSRFLLLWLPVGCWRSMCRRASVSIGPVSGRGGLGPALPAAMEASACGSWDFPGGVRKGLGTKENVRLGRAGSKQTGQEVGLGNGSLSQIPKAGPPNKETQKGTLLPISLFHSQSKHRA